MNQVEDFFYYKEAYEPKKYTDASACTGCRDECALVEVVNGRHYCPHLRVFETVPFADGAR